MSREIFVDASNLIGVKEAASELGVGIGLIMKSCGLDASLLNNPKGFVSWEKFNESLEIAARDFNAHTLGLRIGIYQEIEKIGILGQLMKACPDARIAISKAMEYISVFTQACYWTLESELGYCTVARMPRHSQREVYGQSSSLGVVQSYKLLQLLFGKDWKAHSITFVHSEPGPAKRKEYENYFKVPVSFDQERDSIIFHEHFLELKVETENIALMRSIENHAKSLLKDPVLEESLEGKVRLHIRQSLNASSFSIEAIAQKMKLHPKKFHRDLKREGLTYKDMVNEERFSLACYYLSKSDVSIAVLADILGYSDAAALSRAFKNFSGISPKDWRSLYAHS